MVKRRKSSVVHYGDIPVGGNSAITIQSMTNTDTCDRKSTVDQINKLQAAGCEIIRVAVPDMEAAAKLDEIRAEIELPLIADIHFDFRLALEATRHGVDGIRINPGNIGNRDKVTRVIEAAKMAGIPIRVGVNAGSLEKSLLKKYGSPSPEALVKSALKQVDILENNNFYDTVISIKASDIWKTVEAYKLLARKVDYPFHIGITEAGRPGKGSIKSAVGLGALLTRGFGDTLRVSLTGSPLEEVEVGWQILESLGLRQRGPQIISCPTCGRTEIDLVSLTEKVEAALEDCNKNITVAVMGCAVNGPGEAREADIGIAGGKNEGLIFKNGKLIKKVSEKSLVKALIEEINIM